ncbi:uncharacterized protein LOC111075130 isoform X2 [Drosophila obscura]|uniref:uncharacterized protein LOC111075130 isoform X2 n=1 Tax=Drosophila obscura TaxID=7282 RepID=UPI001BB2ADC2|nr:uncharacterized protein LOC111075130 isoform X2 [Drosophila obscura]
MGLAACICTKILQLISTVAALIVKRLSDKHSERVYVSNQKQSREWRLLNSISGTKEGDDFSTLTFVGFTFISSVLLLTRIIQRNSNYDTCEIILLCFGCLFFTIEGLLILFTVEQLPEEILTFAFLLGALSFFCAALFAVDLMLFKNLLKSKNASAQTDQQLKESATVTMKVFNVSNADKTSCCKSSNLPQLNVRNEQSVLRTDL